MVHIKKSMQNGLVTILSHQLQSREVEHMFELLTNYSDLIIEGFINTLIASVIALIASLILGGLMGIIQTLDNKILAKIGDIYVEFFRNMSILFIVVFYYYFM